MSENDNWIQKYASLPAATKEDPKLNRQFIVDSSWGVRAAYFQHDWGVPHFQDACEHSDEGKYHSDEDRYAEPFRVYRWQEMPRKD